VSAGPEESNLFLTSPPPPFPFTSRERANKLSLRCLERTRQPRFAALADVSIISHSDLSIAGPSSFTKRRSDTVPSSRPIEEPEPSKQDCRGSRDSDLAVEEWPDLTLEDLAQPDMLLVRLELLSRVVRENHKLEE
jgi:hypothetical protein